MENSHVKAITEYFSVPKEIEALAYAANHDLYFGPTSEEDNPDFPGFVAACQQIMEWAQDNVFTVYVDDMSGCISDREPEGYYIDEDGESCDSDEDGATWQDAEPYYLYERRDILQALFGSELTAYL